MLVERGRPNPARLAMAAMETASMPTSSRRSRAARRMATCDVRARAGSSSGAASRPGAYPRRRRVLQAVPAARSIPVCATKIAPRAQAREPSHHATPSTERHERPVVGQVVGRGADAGSGHVAIIETSTASRSGPATRADRPVRYAAVPPPGGQPLGAQPGRAHALNRARDPTVRDRRPADVRFRACIAMSPLAMSPTGSAAHRRHQGYDTCLCATVNSLCAAAASEPRTAWVAAGLLGPAHRGG